MILNNYHTHTSYCDGNNSPEDIVRSALMLGMDELGFSGHSYTSFDESYCMSREGTGEYFDEIKSLAGKYSGMIKILAGIEMDYYGDTEVAGKYSWDHVIGSVHYIKKDGEYIPVDETRDILIDAVNNHYDGDNYGFISDYYKTVGGVYAKTKCDIIGHFDLISKFNEEGDLFDPGDARYMEAWKGALREIKESSGGGKKPLFEVNTGAMSRGYRSVPYPAEDQLSEIASEGFSVILSSDSHDSSTLLYGFPEALELLDGLGISPVLKLGG